MKRISLTIALAAALTIAPALAANATEPIPFEGSGGPIYSTVSTIPATVVWTNSGGWTIAHPVAKKPSVKTSKRH